jgi:hypothetical protein
MKGDKNTEIYQCVHCGKDYKPRRRHSQKYCSSSCNVAACRKRNGYIYNPRYVPPDKSVSKAVLPIIAQGVASSQNTVRNVAESTAGSLIAQAVVKGVEYFVDTKEVTLLRKLKEQVEQLQHTTDPQALINQIHSGLNEMMVLTLEGARRIELSQDKLGSKLDLIISGEDEIKWEQTLRNSKGSIRLFKIYNRLTQKHRYEDEDGKLYRYEKGKGREKGTFIPIKNKKG